MKYLQVISWFHQLTVQHWRFSIQCLGSFDYRNSSIVLANNVTPIDSKAEKASLH